MTRPNVANAARRRFPGNWDLHALLERERNA